MSEPTLFDLSEYETAEEENKRKIQEVAERQKKSHTYFAHNRKSMDPTSLKVVIDEARSVTGGVDDTCNFVLDVLMNAGVNVKKDNPPLSYSFMLADLPENLKHYFPQATSKVRISFASPTPKGYTYIGRNHVFVEDLSRGVVNDTVNGGKLAACRAMVMTTSAVEKKTTIMLMRVRSVINDGKKPCQEIVGEEMIFLGYRGKIENKEFLSQDEAKDLFLNARAAADTDMLSQKRIFSSSMQWTLDEGTLRLYTDDIAYERARHLVDTYTLYRSYLKSNPYQVTKPVLPMDVIAAYVLLPKI